MTSETTTLETQNSYKIISGYLTIIGKQPDGDSMGFIPNNPNAFDGVYRNHLLKPSVRDGSVQLRFEGIDTPELHYGTDMQPHSKSARDYILKLCQFVNTVYIKTGGKNSTIIHSSKPEKIKAYIACNGLEPHGRPISYVYLGTTENDGQVLSIPPNELKNSLNYKMLEEGLAYLLTYSSMPSSHIDYFRAAAIRAKTAKKNIWSIDTTNMFTLEKKSSIEGEEAQLIFPKLFRRCMDYYNDVHKGFNGTFIEWLKKGDDNDMILTYGSNKEVPLSSFIKQRNTITWFRTDSNYLVFIEK